jgi:hypothetical protein
MNEKLIELVRKYKELCDMASKKYSDRIWKEKLNIIDWPNIALFYSAKVQM